MRRKPASAAPVPQTRERGLVPLDQTPLRQEAIGSARAALREISRLNKTIEEFERTIEPTFIRWERETLGELLARESKLKTRIEELMELMEFATIEALFTGRNPYKIFTQAERRKSEEADTPPPDPGPSEEDRAREEEERQRDASFGEKERDFRAHLRGVFGLDPDHMSKGKYKSMFKDYKGWRAKFEASTAAATRSKTSDLPQRFKETYRLLVRRLHPDTGKNPDPFLQSLWHDLQEAYKNRDLERLELLLAITDVNTGGEAAQSTLFHIRMVSKKMDMTLVSLKKRLSRITKSEAWKYWHAKDRKQAGIALRKATEARVEREEINLAQLEAEVAHWKSLDQPKPRTAPTKKKTKPTSARGSSIQKKSTRKKQAPPSATQTSFDF
jgi:hypothetical protein